MEKSKKVLAIFFIMITIVGMLSIGVRFFARNILVYRLGIENSFTRFVLQDIEYNDPNDMSDDSITIDWSKKFPFAKEDLEKDKENRTSKLELFTDYNDSITSFEGKVESKITELFPKYQSFVELSNLYENKIKWKYVGYAEYNGVVALEDNYYIGITSNISLDEDIESTKELADFCKKHGIDFLYAQQPSKVCKVEDSGVNDSIDFSNNNMDRFLESLKKENIQTYDHREDIHVEKKDHHSMFYNTDHHWKVETGFWAAKHLLETINKHFDYNIDLEKLDESLFEKKTYKDVFLGSQGKKVGLKVAKPDDFTLIYPKYDTYIHYIIPDMQIDDYGRFDIMYDKNNIEMNNKKYYYYEANPYAACNYGDHALTKIDNLQNTNGPKVLFIHDSFADCEIPFFSLGVGSVDSIDLRHFNGSVKSYINKNDPDIVIVSYSTFSNNIDWQSHSDFYDFR